MFFHDVVQALASAEVVYCIIGGVAVNLHGIPRLTYDIDLVAALTVPNLSTLEALLEKLGLRSRLPLRLADFADVTYREQMREERNLMAVTFSDPNDPLREVDVLVAPPVSVTELIERAIVLDLEGTSVRIASLEDLIALKRASNRSQDADDLTLLERIASEKTDE